MKNRRPSADRPDVRFEDEFECFKCGNWRSCWWYNYCSDFNIQSPEDIEKLRDNMGHMLACHDCFQHSNVRTWAEKAPKLFPNFNAT